MKKIILCGCSGKMGRTITKDVGTREDCEIVCGVDIFSEDNLGYKVVEKIEDCDVDADVIIDFSHPSLTADALVYAKKRSIPIVVATTGLDEAQLAKVKETSKDVAVFWSANMSLGVNLLSEIAKIATSVLGVNFDVEIVEKHHNQKIDAPSGTALMLANSVCEAMETPAQYVYDRHSQRKKRSANEIGIHAVRGGTIVGEHDIIFAGPDEVITLSHTAYSKSIFATGAINAGIFISDKGPGLYDMNDLIKG